MVNVVSVVECHPAVDSRAMWFGINFSAKKIVASLVAFTVRRHNELLRMARNSMLCILRVQPISRKKKKNISNSIQFSDDTLFCWFILGRYARHAFSKLGGPLGHAQQSTIELLNASQRCWPSDYVVFWLLVTGKLYQNYLETSMRILNSRSCKIVA